MVDVHEFFHEFLHLYVSAYWSILHINPGLSTRHFLDQWGIIVLKPRIATDRQEASRGRMKDGGPISVMARPFLEIPSIYSNCHRQPLSLPIIFLDYMIPNARGERKKISVSLTTSVPQYCLYKWRLINNTLWWTNSLQLNIYHL